MIVEMQISSKELSCTYEDILKLCARNEQQRLMFHDLILKMIPLLENHCACRGGFILFDNNITIDKKKGTVTISNNSHDVVFNTGSIIAHHLRDATSLAVFVSTIGNGMELWSKELLQEQHDPLTSYLVDRTASLLAERTADIVHKKILESFKEKNFHGTQRFSPGYCGWDVSDQKKLFSLLPAKFCGVSINESSLMVPIKSVSGIVGGGKNIVWEDYFCDVCQKEDCLQRISKMNERNKYDRATMEHS